MSYQNGFRKTGSSARKDDERHILRPDVQFAKGQQRRQAVVLRRRRRERRGHVETDTARTVGVDQEDLPNCLLFISVVIHLFYLLLNKGRGSMQQSQFWTNKMKKL